MRKRRQLLLDETTSIDRQIVGLLSAEYIYLSVSVLIHNKMAGVAVIEPEGRINEVHIEGLVS
jgi:predicted small integral membrane protein